MSLISLNLRTPPRAEQRTAIGNLSALWAWLSGSGTTASGEIIDHDIALQVISVNACVKLIAETVASLPLKLYERLDKGRREAVDNSLYEILTVSANPEMSAITLWETVVGCLALTGNSYVYIQRNIAGQVIALWPLNPKVTKWIRLPSGVLAYETSDGSTTGQRRIYDASDIMHFKLFALWDGLTGLSPINFAKESVGLTRSSLKMAARLWANGMRPAGLMTPDGSRNVDDKELAQLKESWQASQSGEHSTKTAFLPGGWKYQAIGLDMNALQFIQQMQFQRTEIAALFRVPAHLIGDTSRQSQSTNEQEALTLVNLTLRPYINRIQVEIARTLLPSVGRNAGRFFVEFDTSQLLAGDHKTQSETLALGRQWGWFSANDSLEELGRNPIGPVGDIYITPVNYQNSENLLVPGFVHPSQSGTETASQEPVTTPTATERNIVQRAIPILPVFRDAVGRLLNREQRSLATITGLFEPALRAITAVSADSMTALTGIDWHDETTTESIVRDVCKGIEKRAGKWTATEADVIVPDEFRKALRAVVSAVYREAGAASVQQLLPPGTEGSINTSHE